MKKIVSFCLFFLVFSTRSFSQNNYFFGAVKVPFVDYVTFLIEHNTKENAKTDGAMFSFGYGFSLADNFCLETGLQAFVANPIYKKYYQGNSSTYDEILGKNQAVFFQINPYYKIELNEDDYLRIGNSLNLGRLFTKATFYKNGPMSQSTASSKSNFLVTLTPFVGAVFFMNKNLALALDLEYVQINWQKTMQHLTCMPSIELPNQKTSNVFLSGKIIFR